MTATSTTPAHIAFLESLTRAFAVIDRDLGIANGSQVSVLRAIESHPGGSVMQLAAAAGLSSSGCVRSLDRLVDRGLVERFDAVDNRSTMVELSDSGVALMATLQRRRTEAVDAALESFDGASEWLSDAVPAAADSASEHSPIR